MLLIRMQRLSGSFLFMTPRFVESRGFLKTRAEDDNIINDNVRWQYKFKISKIDVGGCLRNFH